MAAVIGPAALVAVIARVHEHAVAMRAVLRPLAAVHVAVGVMELTLQKKKKVVVGVMKLTLPNECRGYIGKLIFFPRRLGHMGGNGWTYG